MFQYISASTQIQNIMWSCVVFGERRPGKAISIQVFHLTFIWVAKHFFFSLNRNLKISFLKRIKKKNKTSLPPQSSSIQILSRWTRKNKVIYSYIPFVYLILLQLIKIDIYKKYNDLKLEKILLGKFSFSYGHKFLVLSLI